MHCDIMKLANQLWRQTRVVRYLAINISISSGSNLKLNQKGYKLQIESLQYIIPQKWNKNIVVVQPAHYDPEENRQHGSQQSVGTQEDQHKHAIVLN